MNYITTTPTSTTVSTTVNNRFYTLTNPPSTSPKSKQLQIILTIMSESSNPMTPTQISEEWDKNYISVNRPKDGTLNSVRYHLNRLVKDGVVTF
jgi:hypothetical protein